MRACRNDGAGRRDGRDRCHGRMAALPMVQQFRAFFRGEFGGIELASITPKLGAYFGTNEGVLVVQAPENEVFKLEDGDVIQSIDGRKPDDGAHALRILRSYQLRREAQSQRAAPAQAADARDHDAGASGVRRRSFFDCAGARDAAAARRPPAPGVPGGAGTLTTCVRELSRRMAVNSPPCAAPTSTYELPEELIAQQPLAERSASRLLDARRRHRRARRPAVPRPAGSSSSPATCWCSTTRA